jgi:hypothetical protein
MFSSSSSSQHVARARHAGCATTSYLLMRSRLDQSAAPRWTTRSTSSPSCAVPHLLRPLPGMHRSLAPPRRAHAETAHYDLLHSVAAPPPPRAPDCAGAPRARRRQPAGHPPRHQSPPTLTCASATSGWRSACPSACPPPPP